MLTLFTIPKPFEGKTAVIQRNALQSWMKATRNCEIILCADEPGVAEAAQTYGLKHLPSITRNDYGTPLLDSAFHLVQRAALNRFICYINSDIILASDLTEVLGKIPFRHFLLVGQRWDMDLNESVDFGSDNWKEMLSNEIRERGVLHAPTGSDFFVFPKGSIGRVPSFAVGRPGWDNWFIYHARARGLKVIDATKVVTAIHQNHDYSHVPQRRSHGWEGPEADRNRELLMGREKLFTLHDATWLLTPSGMKRAITINHIKRILPAMSALYPHMNGVLRTVKYLLSSSFHLYRAFSHRLAMLLNRVKSSL